MKTKIIAMVLAAVLCFCSCGSENKTVEPGKVTENVYENSSVGLSFTAPEGWTLLNSKEAAEYYGAANSEVLGDDSAVDTEDSVVSYDMLALSADKNETASVTYVNMKSVATQKMTADEYVTLSAEQVNSQFTSVGYSVSYGGIRSENFGGNEFRGTDITIGMEGSDVTQSFFVREHGDYMLIVSYSSPVSENSAKIASCFGGV